MDEKKKRKSPANFLLVLGLCLMLGCSGIAYLFHTNVGKLVVREITYETQYGSLSGTVYRPNNATSAATTAPVIILAHGYGESREEQSAAAIELSRRGSVNYTVNSQTVTVTGSVVIAIDLYGHGHSTLKAHLSGKDPANLLEMNAAGLWDAVNYVQNLPYANKAKVAIAGVSTETFDVLNKAVEIDNAQFDKAKTDYDAALATGKGPFPGVPVRKIAAVFFTGGAEPKDYGIDYLRGRDVGVSLGRNKSEMKDFFAGADAHKFVNEVMTADNAVSADKSINNGFDKLKDAAYTSNNILAHTAPTLTFKTAEATENAGEDDFVLPVGTPIIPRAAWPSATNDALSRATKLGAVTYTWTRVSEIERKTVKQAAPGSGLPDEVEIKNETQRTTISGATSPHYTLAVADSSLASTDPLVIIKKVSIEVRAVASLPNCTRALYAYSAGGTQRPFKQATAFINFFGNAVQVRPSAYLTAEATSETFQTWWIKEAMTGLALVGFFMFVISAAFALYGAATRKKSVSATAVEAAAAEGASVEEGASAYGTAATEKPYAPDAPRSKAGRLIYWIGFGLTIILSGLFFWLMFRAGSGSFNGFFNQPVTNGILTALIVTGVIGLGLFILSAFLNKKYAGGPGLKESLLSGVPSKAPNILKGLLIAAGVVFAGFSIAGFVQWLWQVDFRFWLWAVNTFELRVLGSVLKYLLFFAVYFVIQSYVINNGVAAKRREVWNYLLAIAVSAGGLALLAIIYYLGALGGANLFGQSLLPIVSVMMIPLLALSAVISRLAYNKTGTIWLGAILNTVLMTALLCAGTVTLY